MGPVPPMSAYEIYQQLQKGKKKKSSKKALVAGFAQVAKEVQELTNTDRKKSPSQSTVRESYVLVPSLKEKNAKKKLKKSTNGVVALNGSPANGSGVKSASGGERLKLNPSTPASKRKLKRLKKQEVKSIRSITAHPETSTQKSTRSEERSQDVVEKESPKTAEKVETGKAKKKDKRNEQPSPKDTGNVSIIHDSRKEGKKLLGWVLTPISIADFLEKYWEKRPLYIRRPAHPDYFRHILTSEQIDQGLREHRMYFTKNIDITSYVNGVKETHNPVGRAFGAVVWDLYRNGCSVRILNPQTFFPHVRKLCTGLQDCFNSFVGANVYLTPPNSQGFAPHYDDIEAFVLQLEGQKKWKVYPPRKGEKLPRTSSRNYTQEEMTEPILEVTLNPGDMLYMPRGFIHQASTVPGAHSLHITVSTYQHSSWADFMEKVVPAALANAIEEDDEFREGIPWDFFQNMGAVYSTDETPKRNIVTEKIKRLFSKLFTHAPIDAAADQLARDYLHESLPPMLSKDERHLCVHDDGDTLKNGEVSPQRQLSLDCSIRLVRHGVLRLVSEDNPDTVSLYHCADNPLVYKEEEEQFLEVAVQLAPAVEALIRNYPNYTRVSDLPLEDDELKVAVELWERGLVMTKKRLPPSEVTMSED